jgi:two-component system LytT family response regulator
MIRLPFNEIILIEGLSEYVKIHMKEKQIITLAALKDLETKLPADEFISIHKSYIISGSNIYSYRNSQVQMSNGLQLPVGRVYKENFIKHANKKPL